jgi:hypothetical protein
MKRTLILATCLFAACSIAWAAGPTPDLGTVEPGLTDGCKLPDLSGLSPEQEAAAALAAGFRVAPTNKALPLCPTVFRCNSIANCAAGPLCALGNIGPCCTTPSGLGICCTGGLNIWVQQCPCQCTGFACSFQCVNSTDVTRFCA